MICIGENYKISSFEESGVIMSISDDAESFGKRSSHQGELQYCNGQILKIWIGENQIDSSIFDLGIVLKIKRVSW